MMSVLGIIAEELNKIGIPYEFMRWTSPDVGDRYWIGEYSEAPGETGDGCNDITLMLTGTTRGAWAVLEQDKEKIKNHFPHLNGLRLFKDGWAVVIFYDLAFPIDTGEADLKRIQINLQIKEWKVN